MQQSQCSFWSKVPWQAPEFAFPSQPCSHPGSILTPCFIAWSAARPPATAACFTVLCGQTHAAFSAISEALLMECSASWHALPSCQVGVGSWGFPMLQRISPYHREKGQAGCCRASPKLSPGGWLEPKYCWSPVFHLPLAKWHCSWAALSEIQQLAQWMLPSLSCLLCFLPCSTIYSPATLPRPDISSRLFDCSCKYCRRGASYPPHFMSSPCFIPAAFPHDLHEWLCWIQAAAAITNQSPQYLFLANTLQWKG